MAVLQVRRIEYEPEQEHIVRRLGGAVALHWNLLSPEAQMLILAQAVMVDDRDQFSDVETHLERFLRKTALKE